MTGWARGSLSLECVSGGVDEGGKSIRCDFQTQRKETWWLQRTVMIRDRSMERKERSKEGGREEETWELFGYCSRTRQGSPAGKEHDNGSKRVERSCHLRSSH